MNKTFAEIFGELLTAKEANTTLSALDSTSKTSIWRQFLEVISWAIFNFQNAANLHLQEIKELIANQKVFNLRKYRSEALRFQYGFDLIDETDIFKPSYLDDGIETTATEEQIEASKIIKYAACSRVIADNKVRIVMKIAPENLDEIFSSDTMQAFGKYMDEIQPSGDHLTIVNYLPDVLQFSFKIKYDAKILLSDGMNILTAKFPVRESIEKFLQNDLPFNGELSVQKLEDAIRAVEGVEDLQTYSVETKWIDPQLNGYGYFQPVNMSVIPASGRFKVENWEGFEYVT